MKLTEQDVKAIANNRVYRRLYKHLVASFIGYLIIAGVSAYFLDKARVFAMSLFTLMVVLYILTGYLYGKEQKRERQILLDAWSREISEG